MRRAIGMLAVMLVLSCAAWAQADLPKFDVPMPSKAEALKMRYSGLCEFTDKHARQANEVQNDDLARWYADIRNQANRQALAGHPGKKALEAATLALTRWVGGRWNLEYLYAGGGTMYIHASARSVASVADTEADAITAWNTKGNTSNLGAFKPFRVAAPKLPNYSSATAAEYRKALDEDAAALVRLQTAVRALSPGAQSVFIKSMKDVPDGPSRG